MLKLPITHAHIPIPIFEMFKSINKFRVQHAFLRTNF